MGWHNPIKKIGKELGRTVEHIADVAALPGKYVVKGLTEAATPVIQGAGYLWNELNGTNAMLKAAELQNEYNLKYWQMQNAYNTPSAQMQRFIDAGLNPNLAYSMSNTAGDIGRVNVGTPDSALGVASKVVSAISAWQGIKNMRLQNENLAYQSDYNYEMARRARIDNNYLERNGLSSFSPSWPKNILGTVDALKDHNPLNSLFSFIGDLVGSFDGYIPMEQNRPMKPKGWTMESRGDRGHK